MKNIFLLILLVILPIAVFAADFSISAGGGGLIGYTFTRYTLAGDDNTGKYVESIQNMDRINYGGFLFFDVTYAEISVLYQAANNKYSESVKYPGNVYLTEDKGIGKEQSFALSVMGKYPLNVSKKIKLFPMIGLEYHFALVQKRQPEGDLMYNREDGELKADRDKDDNPYPLSAWNSLWINVGLGADFYFTGSLFMRGELLFGFRLPTSYEMGALEVVKQEPTNIKDPSMAGLTGTPSLRVSLGYRIKSK
ncbi:MAG: hypothetical protein FWB95_06155 [Treponema sp.]|nr:hypothetical protein [Treponema sp.]